jgi:hypothetical protein
MQIGAWSDDVAQVMEDATDEVAVVRVEKPSAVLRDFFPSEGSSDADRDVQLTATMSLEEIFDYFTQTNGCGLAFIPPKVWHQINGKYRQCEIKRVIAKQIIKHKAPFPLHPPARPKASSRFKELRKKPFTDLIAAPINDGRPYQSRVPYPSWTIDNTLAVIPGNSTYNAISNHFQWENRMRCGGWKDPSPRDAWSTEDNIYILRWSLWTMHKDGPNNAMIWKISFLLSATGIYLASQFRPSAAKAMYGWLGAECVLDPSCGWGDRLAGFFATSTAKVYAGCDPNAETYKDYIRQCEAYETREFRDREDSEPLPIVEHFTVSGYPAFRSRGQKDVCIVNGPFEDIDWKEIQALVAPEGFDLVFTSPPYFGVERYAAGTDKSSNQSWSRYNQFVGWRDSFFFPMLRTSTDVLKEGGILAMNVVDPIVNKVRNEACDPMISELCGYGMKFAGVVPMAMARRPSSSVDGMGAIPADRFAEPVWMFTKGPRDLPSLEGGHSEIGKEPDPIRNLGLYFDA